MMMLTNAYEIFEKVLGKLIAAFLEKYHIIFTTSMVLENYIPLPLL